MAYFRNGFSFCNFGSRGPRVSLFSGGMLQAVRLLVSIALMLTGMGVLVILFPRVLAYFVAGLFFFVAVVCLQQAWKIYKASRRINDIDVNVDMESEDDFYDCPPY